MSYSFLSNDPIAIALSGADARLNYPCEDVRSYYSDVDGLRGPSLLKKLGSLVHKHKSVPYKQVIDFLVFFFFCINRHFPLENLLLKY